ncbi:hypothetical protein WA026_020376 [Henosepilachna vigintioctopunctata]|uniref:BACK domain-containing protein n=1 Tax=Henosepilachna vigintioctopunctata TaxID=420089 RepID=A0AAW1UMG1_9CUCU
MRLQIESGCNFDDELKFRILSVRQTLEFLEETSVVIDDRSLVHFVQEWVRNNLRGSSFVNLNSLASVSDVAVELFRHCLLAKKHSKLMNVSVKFVLLFMRLLEHKKHIFRS